MNQNRGVIMTRRFPSVIEEAIASKKAIKDITAKTFRTDSAAILESLVAEFDEKTILKALKNQGFAANAYSSTLKSLIEVAKDRRSIRRAENDQQI